MRGRIQHQLQPARMGSCEARAYCAGLIDGDGCLSIARQLKPDARRGYIFRLTLDITQNHLGTLLDFRIWSKKRPFWNKNRPQTRMYTGMTPGLSRRGSRVRVRPLRQTSSKNAPQGAFLISSGH